MFLMTLFQNFLKPNPFDFGPLFGMFSWIFFQENLRSARGKNAFKRKNFGGQWKIVNYLRISFWVAEDRDIEDGLNKYFKD